VSRMCVKTCTSGGNAAMNCAWLVSTSLMSRLEMYFFAEVLRDAGVVGEVGSVLCGNCLRCRD
jgi:hypothetical protein